MAEGKPLNVVLNSYDYMKHAPDDIQYGYLKLLDRVFLKIRSNDFSYEEELSDLGDALHNISALLLDYGKWIDDKKYRELYLRAYDTKWGHIGFTLESVLKKYISEFDHSNDE